MSLTRDGYAIYAMDMASATTASIREYCCGGDRGARVSSCRNGGSLSSTTEHRTSTSRGRMYLFTDGVRKRKGETICRNRIDSCTSLGPSRGSTRRCLSARLLQHGEARLRVLNVLTGLASRWILLAVSLDSCIFRVIISHPISFVRP